MLQILSLTKRNILVFLRDRMAVFFSLLSSIILVVLYITFITSMYMDGLDSPEIPLENNEKYFLIYLQMIAGVLILNSVSLSTGVFSTAAKDFESKRTDNFLITPLKPLGLIASYYISGATVSFVMNLITWIVSFVLIGAITGFWVSAGAFFMAVLIVLVTSLLTSALMLLVTALLRSSTAVSVVSSILGTFLGFLCGIYIPYSNLGSASTIIGSLLPFTHLTIWLKQTVLLDAFASLEIPEVLHDTLLKQHFSANDIGFCGLDVPLYGMLIIAVGFSVICLVTALIVMIKRMPK